jgi:uncharacterized protein (TIGR02453 family)
VTPRFSPKAIAFLRALKRNNNRDWFKARREQYEVLLRGPMIEIIEQLASDFRDFAPELLASPKTSLFRMYRDTRFSDDKSPLKTQVAAVFPNRRLPKHGGAGLYFHVAPEGVWAGGGLHLPPTPLLQLVRERIASNSRQFRAIVESPAFRRGAGALDESEQLQRVPRGFRPDHEAARYLKLRQFIAGREFSAAFATSPRFYAGLLGVFRQVAPLVRFLNEPLLKASKDLR